MAPGSGKTFRDLFYVVSPGFEENGGGQYHLRNLVGNLWETAFTAAFDGPDFTLVDNPWLDEAHSQQPWSAWCGASHIRNT